MSFSDLSRELRNIIYHGVLCPPDGVHLQHVDWDRRTRKFKADVFSIIDSGHDSSEEDGNNNRDTGMDGDQVEDLDLSEMRCLWPDMWEISSLDLSAIVPAPTAIFYVNKQIRQEATEVFYAFNRFTFNSSARAALHFLKSLPPSRRQRIKNLGFTRRSAAADDYDCTYSWSALCDLIIQHMSINSVTIQAPRHRRPENDETKPAKEAPYTKWYWWPAPRSLTAALMAGKIQQLRIAYSATMTLDDLLRESPYQDAEHLRHIDSVEGVEAISNLRHPRPPEELEREALEGKALRRAIATGQPHEFDSMDTLIADQERRRQKFNFVVTREDDPVGDLGTVLVLTRPTTS